MSLQDDIDHFLNKGAADCWDKFLEEINTDEDKSYRRGFKAGLLCAHLIIKSQIGNIRDASTQRPTD